jgi:hypothetical protein
MDPRATKLRRLTRILIIVALAAFWMGPPMPPRPPGCWGPRRPPMPLHEAPASTLPN